MFSELFVLSEFLAALTFMTTKTKKVFKIVMFCTLAIFYLHIELACIRYIEIASVYTLYCVGKVGLGGGPQYHRAGHWLGSAPGQIHNTSGQGIQMNPRVQCNTNIMPNITGNTRKTEVESLCEQSILSDFQE